MLIDGYDQYNQQEAEVVNISPDEGSEEPGEPPVRADDCRSRALHRMGYADDSQSRP